MTKITRSIDQIIFKHTPGSFIGLEEAGMYGIVTIIKGKQDTDVDKTILAKNVKQSIKKWEESEEGYVLGYSSNEIDDNTIIPIRPQETVLWDFLPRSLFECTNPKCKLLVSCDKQGFTGICSECGSKLKQFKFVYFHSCGFIRALEPISDTYCPIHGNNYLYLNDTGKFQTSYWRCLKCNHESSIRMPVCPNAQCRQVLKQKNERFSLRGAIWNDPWTYFPKVMTFVNLKDEQIKPVLNSDKKNELLISAYIGSVGAGQGKLKSKALEDQQNIICPVCKKPIPINSKFCNYCAAEQPVTPDIQVINIPHGLSLDTQSDDSEVAIFAAVRDLERTVSFKEKRTHQEEEQDIEQATMSTITLNKFRNIGIDDIFLIGDFPLTHVAYGYTRHQSKPPAWLRAFPPLSQTDTKIPVYTNCVTTESWMIQLSGKYLVNWLIENGMLINKGDILNNNSEEEAKIFLLELMNKNSKDESDLKLQSTIFELIHSLSHTLLYSLALESGLDIASFGEILLTKALSFIIYGGESDMGGLSASFHRSISSVIDSVTEELRSCKFDPSCSSDDDGACVGCLQIPRGCSELNERLSRAYVFGGKTKKLTMNNIKIGYIDFSNI